MPSLNSLGLETAEILYRNIEVYSLKMLTDLHNGTAALSTGLLWEILLQRLLLPG